MKRVSDVNAMGAAPLAPNQFMQGPSTQNYMQPIDPYANGGIPQPQNYGFQTSPSPMVTSSSPTPQQYSNFGHNQQQLPAGFPPQQQMPGFNPQFSMFQQPIVQDMAMQYGQKLADQGKQMVESTFEKWIPVTKLKYYFAVDNNYVINKLRLIFFPFMHKVSSLINSIENFTRVVSCCIISTCCFWRRVHFLAFLVLSMSYKCN